MKGICSLGSLIKSSQGDGKLIKVNIFNSTANLLLEDASIVTVPMEELKDPARVVPKGRRNRSAEGDGGGGDGNGQTKTQRAKGTIPRRRSPPRRRPTLRGSRFPDARRRGACAIGRRTRGPRSGSPRRRTPPRRRADAPETKAPETGSGRPRGDGRRPRGEGPRGEGRHPRGEDPRDDGGRPRGEGSRGEGRRPRGEGPRGEGRRPRGEGPRDGRRTPRRRRLPRRRPTPPRRRPPRRCGTEPEMRGKRVGASAAGAEARDDATEDGKREDPTEVAMENERATLSAWATFGRAIGYLRAHWISFFAALASAGGGGHLLQRQRTRPAAPLRLRAAPRGPGLAEPEGVLPPAEGLLLAQVHPALHREHLHGEGRLLLHQPLPHVPGGPHHHLPPSPEHVRPHREALPPVLPSQQDGTAHLAFRQRRAGRAERDDHLQPRHHRHAARGGWPS